jgi:hypothetical protein
VNEHSEQDKHSEETEEIRVADVEPSRAGAKSRRGWVWAAVLAVLAFFAVDPLGLHPGDEYLMHLLGFHGAEEESAGDGQLWTCGMHPEVILDEPGQCPICHRDLVPLAAGDAMDEAAAGAG